MLPAEHTVPDCLGSDLERYEAGKGAAVQALVLHIWPPPSACPAHRELTQTAVSGAVSAIPEGCTGCAGGSNTDQALDHMKSPLEPVVELVVDALAVTRRPGCTGVASTPVASVLGHVVPEPYPLTAEQTSPCSLEEAASKLIGLWHALLDPASACCTSSLHLGLHYDGRPCSVPGGLSRACDL